ncbi:MAG: hypothetical protein WCP69_12830 [Bacteroidota bacterium]
MKGKQTKLFTKKNKNMYFKAKMYMSYAFVFSFIIFLSSSTYSQSYLTLKNASIKMNGDASLITNSIILNREGVIKMTSNSNNLVIQGNLVNNTGLTNHLDRGNVIFSGNSNQEIAGADKILFNNIVINKIASSEVVSLKQDIDVNGSLKMTKGTIDLENYNINLGALGKVENETNENRIKSSNLNSTGYGNGQIISTPYLISGVNNNIAGLGIDINSNTYFGEQTIIRSHQNKPINKSSASSISRSFSLSNFGKITEENNFSIHYFPVELNGLSEDELAIYKIGHSMESTPIKSSIDNINKKASSEIDNEVNIVQTENFDEMNTYTLGLKSTITNPIIANNIITQSLNSSDTFKSYYSSNDQTINIEFNSSEISIYKISVFNPLSKKMVEFVFPVNKGENKAVINASNFSNSMYIITMFNDTKQYTSKTIINK